LVLVQVPLEVGYPTGTIRDIAGRTDLTPILGSFEVSELKERLGERARPYAGFFLKRKRGEYGSIIELYGFHEYRLSSPIFAVETARRKKNE